MSELPTHVQELLSNLSAGGNPIDLLLGVLTAEDAGLLRRCAIPHTFSPRLLRVIDPVLSVEQAEAKYSAMGKLSIVRPIADRLALHDEARAHLFRDWLSGGDPEFSDINARLAGYFRDHIQDHGLDSSNGEEMQVRMVFHLIGADRTQGMAEFESTARLLRYRLHWAMLERLFGLVSEYVPVLSAGDIALLRFHRGIFAADMRQWPNAKKIFESLLSNSAADQDLRLRSRIRLAMVESARRDWDAAIQQFKVVLDELERSGVGGDPKGQRTLLAYTLLDFGTAWREKRDFTKARTYIDRGFGLAETLDDYLRANAYNVRGRLYADLGEREQAIEDYRRSLALLEKAGDLVRAADLLNNIGLEYLDSTQWQESRTFFERSLEIKKNAEDPTGEARVLNNLARLERRANQQLKAIGLLDQAAQRFEEVHDYFGAAVATRNLARCYRAINDTSAFVTEMRKAQELFKRAEAAQEVASIDVEIKSLKWPKGCIYSIVITVISVVLLVIMVLVLAMR